MRSDLRLLFTSAPKSPSETYQLLAPRLQRKTHSSAQCLSEGREEKNSLTPRWLHITSKAKTIAILSSTPVYFLGGLQFQVKSCEKFVPLFCNGSGVTHPC